MSKIFGYCGACGNYFYREQCKRHGDGQQDTESNPIWLSTDTDAMSESEIEQADGNKINCGCND